MYKTIFLGILGPDKSQKQSLALLQLTLVQFTFEDFPLNGHYGIMLFLIKIISDSDYRRIDNVCCTDNTHRSVELCPYQMQCSNLIYIIECQRCNHEPQYAGKTKGCLMVRGGQHRRLVQDELLEKPKLYQHFSSNGHSVNDMKFFAIEVVKGDVFTLEARERYWIDNLCTITRGLNSNRA